MLANTLRRGFDSFCGALHIIEVSDVLASAWYSLRISPHVSRLVGMALESGAQNEITDN